MVVVSYLFSFFTGLSCKICYTFAEKVAQAQAVIKTIPSSPSHLHASDK